MDNVLARNLPQLDTLTLSYFSRLPYIVDAFYPLA